eukprot:EG_transcript_18287
MATAWASAPGPEHDFDAEARKLFASLNLPASGSARPGCSRYSNLDPIWGHPGTGAKVFVGNYVAASKLEILHEHHITHIVNLQNTDAVNYHEKDPAFTYLRFPIAFWARAPKMDTNAGVLSFLQPVLSFIQRALEDGRNVLLHCLAGAHRAGTMGVIVLMHFAGLRLPDALAAAKKCRPVINPIGMLIQLLDRCDRALEEGRAAAC